MLATQVLQILRTEKPVRDKHAGRGEHQQCASRDRTARQDAHAQQRSPYSAFDDNEHAV